MAISPNGQKQRGRVPCKVSTVISCLEYSKMQFSSSGRHVKQRVFPFDRLHKQCKKTYIDLLACHSN